MGLHGFFRSIRSRAQRVGGDECGQSIVETALTLTVTLTTIFMFLSVSMLIYTYSMISETAREASRYAATHGATCVTAANVSCTLASTDIQTYAKSVSWPNIGGGTISPTVSYSNSGVVGTTVTVKIAYAFKVIIPFLPASLSTVSLSSTSQSVIVQ